MVIAWFRNLPQSKNLTMAYTKCKSVGREHVAELGKKFCSYSNSEGKCHMTYCLGCKREEDEVRARVRENLGS